MTLDLYTHHPDIFYHALVIFYLIVRNLLRIYRDEGGESRTHHCSYGRVTRTTRDAYSQDSTTPGSSSTPLDRSGEEGRYPPTKMPLPSAAWFETGSLVLYHSNVSTFSASEIFTLGVSLFLLLLCNCILSFGHRFPPFPSNELNTVEGDPRHDLSASGCVWHSVKPVGLPSFGYVGS